MTTLQVSILNNLFDFGKFKLDHEISDLQG